MYLLCALAGLTLAHQLTSGVVFTLAHRMTSGIVFDSGTSDDMGRTFLTLAHRMTSGVVFRQNTCSKSVLSGPKTA